MGFLDKAKDLLSQSDDKVDQALDKGGEAAKGRFVGHEGHVDTAVDRAQAMTGAGDTTQAPPVQGMPAEEQQLEPTPVEPVAARPFDDQQVGDQPGDARPFDQR